MFSKITRYALVAAFLALIAVQTMPRAQASVLTDLMAWFYPDLGPGFGAQPQGGPGDGEGDAD